MKPSALPRLRVKFLAAILVLPLQAASPRTTPPTLNNVSPQGIARGTTVELTVEGLNLARASAIFFSEPGVTGRVVRVKELPDLPDIRLGSNGTPSTIDLGPLPPRNQVTVEVDVSADADIGPVSFRLLTPLGTSPEGRFLIEPYYGESADREPDDTPEAAVETFLPAILTGAISRPGDVDYFKIQVRAGQEIAFQNNAAAIGSQLQPVVTIFDSDLHELHTYGENGGTEQLQFAHRFAKAGTYYIRIADYQQSGRGGNTYRIIAGEFPLLASAWPLGIRRGATANLALRGSHVASRLKVEPTKDSEDTAILRPDHAFNQLRVALGDDPEIESQGGAIQIPVTVNGRIDKPAAENRYRFHARKGEQLLLEVNARRLGSDLDSFLEVLDANGRPIERALVRPVWETNMVLRDHGSTDRGLRISSWNELHAGDYMMVGSEVIRVEALPLSPDADTIFEGFGGQRLTFLDTTAEAHAIDSPIYKVQILPPGAKTSPNGLPVAHLYYRNDDGGPGYGRDSVVHFTAPEDADYIVRIADTNKLGGENFGYRLTVHHPSPDFRLSVSPRNPNVPLGGAVPITVTATRLDGFNDAIDVALADQPAGLQCDAGVIRPGQVSTTLILRAPAALAAPAALNVTGKSGRLQHSANPDDHLKLIAVAARPDLTMTAETPEVTIRAGGTAEITVSIQRQSGFQGRVPVEVRNLPPYVRVLDVGLNGVLITEDESRRTFTLEAQPIAPSGEQLIYVDGAVETRSPQMSAYAAPQPIKLRVITAAPAPQP